MRQLSRTVALVVGLNPAGCSPPASEAAAAQRTPGVASEADHSAPHLDSPVTPATVHYADLLAATRRRATKARAAAERNGRSAMVYGRAAADWMAVARLSADYEDFAVADEMLAAPFSIGDVIPPYQLRARLHFTLHRLDAAQADLDGALAMPAPGPDDDASGAGRALFAAQLAYQRGAYAQAREGLNDALATSESAGALAASAYYDWQTGAFDRAEAAYRRALDRYGTDIDMAEPAAWVHLQLGLMDLARGRYGDAHEHYRNGTERLAGYWLLEEHIAQVLALQGKTEEAEAIYRDVIERTGNPEFMGALAAIVKARGESDESAVLVSRATAAYQARLARFPEATYGHALEHHLEHGPPDVALDLATKNHQIRPNAEAKVLLARAQLDAGNVEEARSTIEQALASPIQTAELHAVASAIYRATDHEERASRHAEQARSIHPTIDLGG